MVESQAYELLQTQRYTSMINLFFWCVKPRDLLKRKQVWCFKEAPESTLKPKYHNNMRQNKKY